MIHCDWEKKVRQMQYQSKNHQNSMNINEDDDKETQDLPFLIRDLNINNLDLDLPHKHSVDSSDTSSVTYRCVPIAIKPKEVNDVKSQRSCCVCAYEGRGRIVKDVNFCTTHRLRLCTRVHDNPKDKPFFNVHGINYRTTSIKIGDFLCEDQSLNYWEKAHRFYIPQGLFQQPANRNKISKNIQGSNDLVSFSTCSKLTPHQFYTLPENRL